MLGASASLACLKIMPFKGGDWEEEGIYVKRSAPIFLWGSLSLRGGCCGGLRSLEDVEMDTNEITD